jgi:phosphate transport system ATP-binding protein
MGSTAVSDDGAAVRIRGLRVSFHGRPALRGVDLTVPARGITVIVGPSGAGKTTLLRAVNRLNECFSGCRTEGEVRIRLDGRWVDVQDGSVPVTTLRRRAAMVFQTPNVLPTTVERNFEIPLRSALGVSRAEAAERTRDALARVGLLAEVEDRLGAPAASLSGGQQQRLCLARALAMEPALLLLDEPTASLDVRSTRRIEDLLRVLARSYPIVAVSHGPGQARRLADRVAVVEDGRVVEMLEGQDLGRLEELL